jgi:hypothetical protein
MSITRTTTRRSQRRLGRTDVVYRTASGQTLIATAPSGRPQRRWLRAHPTG